MELMSRDDNNYLDISRTPECIEITRIAYVHDVQIGATRYSDTFVKFYLKDCNANTVVARLFQVDDFLMSGVNAAAFKHKPVKFKCVAQEYNGSLSLVISGKEGIKVYDGDFDYAKFIGKIDSDLSRLQDAYCVIDEQWFVPKAWYTESIDELAFGRVGAFGKVVEIVFSCIEPLITEDNHEELLRTFVVSMEYWFKYLKSKQNVSVIGSLESFDLLNEVAVRYHEDNCKLLFLDTTRSVIGISKPMHLFAHMIKDATDYAIKMMKLSVRFESQILATKTFVGGVELSKY